MTTGKLAIIGHPIIHAMSPVLHTAAFRSLGMPWTYEALDVAEHEVADVVDRLEREQYAGFNITIPHKIRVMTTLTDLDATAEACGAVNTVVLGNGKRVGYNTDVLGVVASLAPYRSRLETRSAVIIGAGGAARACAFAFVRMLGLRSITIAARQIDQARAILDQLKIDGTPMSLESLELQGAVDAASLIANSTPVGMFPKADVSPLPEGIRFSEHHIVFDAIYRPLQTRFMREAATAGATVVGGLEMLIQQGAAAFQLWTGTAMPLEPVRMALLERLKNEGM